MKRKEFMQFNTNNEATSTKKRWSATNLIDNALSKICFLILPYIYILLKLNVVCSNKISNPNKVLKDIYVDSCLNHYFIILYLTI